MRYRTRSYIRGYLTVTGTFLVLFIGSAWSLMIMAGNAHADWWPRVPAMGFRTAISLTSWPIIFSTATLGLVMIIRELGR